MSPLPPGRFLCQQERLQQGFRPNAPTLSALQRKFYARAWILLGIDVRELRLLHPVHAPYVLCLCTVVSDRPGLLPDWLNPNADSANSLFLSNSPPNLVDFVR